jgi:hypothetical protein
MIITSTLLPFYYFMLRSADLGVVRKCTLKMRLVTLIPECKNRRDHYMLYKSYGMTFLDV